MKKVICIFIILIITIFLIPKKIDVVQVISYSGSEYATGYIIIPGLTTKNINSYFNDNAILGLIPYINPIYKTKINNIYFSFNTDSIDINIKKFSNYYRLILEKNNLQNELINISYNGIKIDKVKVTMLNTKLRKLLSNCLDCTFEKLE